VDVDLGTLEHPLLDDARRVAPAAPQGQFARVRGDLVCFSAVRRERGSAEHDVDFGVAGACAAGGWLLADDDQASAFGTRGARRPDATDATVGAKEAAAGGREAEPVKARNLALGGDRPGYGPRSGHRSRRRNVGWPEVGLASAVTAVIEVTPAIAAVRPLISRRRTMSINVSTTLLVFRSFLQ
jgi:hypothetical protein